VKSLAWPAVVVWAIWYLRSELKAAAKRITEIGPTGAKFAPPEQQVPTDPTKIAVPTESAKAAIGDARADKANLQTYIGKLKLFVSEDQLEPSVKKMHSDLLELIGSNTTDQIEALEYLAAALNVQLSHERNYNTIFGSQLGLLAQANAGVTPEMARALYEKAKAANPTLYSTYTFDQWIGFLINSGLLQLGPRGAYVLTNYGRGFLKYIVDRQLAVNKPF
jgi:hypothetical protein